MKDKMIPLINSAKNIFLVPVRSKKDIIVLWMNTIKYIKSTITINRDDWDGKSYIRCVIDDMNRFIYLCPEKIFSVRSPFMFKDSGTMEIDFYTKAVFDIDQHVTSKVISFIRDNHIDATSPYSLLDSFEENFDDISQDSTPEKPYDIWLFILDLMMCEDGYIRYDHDQQQENGRRHPLYHFDIGYETASTYKIGSYRSPCPNYLFELLNNKYDSKYLEK